VARWRAEGQAGLVDRTSEPNTVANRTACERSEAIASLRRLRMTSAEIAESLGMALSTVCGALQRIGLGKLSRLEPPKPPNRYQREHPSELIHIVFKKLGRIAHRGAAHRATAAVAPARAPVAAVGSSSTSASMTPRGLPTSRCSRRRRR